MSGIPYPQVGGSYTLEELEAKARELHDAAPSPEPPATAEDSARHSHKKKSPAKLAEESA